MTSVIVNDASCLIDLRKGGLLHVVLELPFRFVIPLPIRQSELLDFTDHEWRLLDEGGIETFDLPPKRVKEAFAVRYQYPRLSANDCFCLVSMRCYENGILLTGDALLRRVAAEDGVCVHGVLWIIDELEAANVCDEGLLISALEIWRDDYAVFLPVVQIERRLKRLRGRR